MAPRTRHKTARPIRVLTDLTADPRNANRGTARGRDALDRSLREFGPARSIVIDRTGTIIAGHKTVERATRLGIPLRVVQTDGRHLIAVQRRDLDLARDPRARELALADNRVGELDLEWDIAMLQRLQADGLDLSAWWSAEEFAALMDQHQGPGKTDENAVIAPGATDIQVGDLFILGRHRLLCGDATSATDVARVLDGRRPLLMTTDPPYGVRYAPERRHAYAPGQRTAVGRVLNDDRVDWTAAYAGFPGSIAYVWHAGLFAGTVADNLSTVGFTLRSQIIWRKQHFALSRASYHWQHEPCWYAVREGHRSAWRGDRTQTTVWDVPNLNAFGGDRTADNAVTGHATQKPVALFEIPIKNHTTLDDGVYDPFCGSGTAIIAAEKSGRSCTALDLDPQYVQVAVSRWERYTGLRAERFPAARRARSRRS